MVGLMEQFNEENKAYESAHMSIQTCKETCLDNNDCIVESSDVNNVE